ncbi:MAG: ABC transporter ATP-binding protein [Clostridiales bacterium]|nr:ABC transporter ATP-binding protein [Clostridiales bacterium]
MNLEIPASKKLGIVGLNGSGKTTLIKLMLRLYTPTEGQITLGGVNIAEIPYRQYAKHIGVVLQDFSLFSYSFKENIVFGGAYHPRRMIECIEKSGLSDKIKKLPKGIETSIYRDLDDNGVEFSGGEGQKLAMARAIYKDADMLILDEPSSALDAIAEYELFSRLNEISENKTTVFISHRLSSTLFCDHIVVLNDGMIIEQGNHSSLMQKNGFYANLYHSQAKYYEENGVIYNEIKG